MADQQPYFTLRSRRPVDWPGARQPGGPVTNGIHDGFARSATHDTSRTSFHVKHISAFAQRLEDSATRAFPNRGRSSQRYKTVQALLLYWESDDLFVLPELEDLEKCLREEYAFGTNMFAIPSENSHLLLMLRVGQFIKDFESQDTLFLIYYGGHARIDESRQSTWCATRDSLSPELQWSAIQTLVERSKSDALILLDCCAGAASATFPNGNSVTEIISASSWDAIAPNPGRFSFSQILIEVLQEWVHRTFSAAMLHAEVLARLKHPRLERRNGTCFEARSTPVHFMMTSNHKVPSIEISRLLPPEKTARPEPFHLTSPLSGGRAPDFDNPNLNGFASSEPDEDTPHVMISLALEDDQRLDINAWEQWLNAFPSLAKHVKVQGVFKSHSTLMLVSVPVMIWDLLPEDPAVSFVAFIRSNNLAMPRRQSLQRQPIRASCALGQQGGESENSDSTSIATGATGTTLAATENFRCAPSYAPPPRVTYVPVHARSLSLSQPVIPGNPTTPLSSSPGSHQELVRPVRSTTSLHSMSRQATDPSMSTGPMISRQMILNHTQTTRRTNLGENLPELKKFAPHVEKRLEEYYQEDPMPSDAHSAFIASNLGIELLHFEIWLHHRRESDPIPSKLATMRPGDAQAEPSAGARMILPAHLDSLLEFASAGNALLFDLRSASEYEKSHIFGAIHLRAPRHFLAAASLDLIGRSIPQDSGRDQLSQWRAAKCLVFYGRGLESTWECPAADILAQKMRAYGWAGQCFILRGHYRDFSQSFGKYIVGMQMTREARDWLRSLASSSPVTGADVERREQRYSSWLARLDKDHQARPPSTSPSQTPERREAFESQERDLEKELKRRCDSLFESQERDLETELKRRCDSLSESQKRDLEKGLRTRCDSLSESQKRDLEKGAQDTLTRCDFLFGNARDGEVGSGGVDHFDAKAAMVEYLDRGLEELRGATHQAPAAYAPGHSKTASESHLEGYPGQRTHDQDLDSDYVEVREPDGSTPAVSPPGIALPERSTTGDTGGGGGGGGGLLNKMFRR
ncbi:tyrosine-protein phosphatase non-receptor type 6 [Moelleriella libera RCEF 2490]|uniref:Tyrosine-protein phosphatase non-receptor type 6 n=1 Tax=Moelleriella libera RCEF 2490 TaxID=1081109 RepID=A0A168BGM5_9HYPO|nr:tyrosine-protein phosphatase non-receptor type 6 [Moelleriella libera RCEF 2490]